MENPTQAKLSYEIQVLAPSFCLIFENYVIQFEWAKLLNYLNNFFLNYTEL